MNTKITKTIVLMAVLFGWFSGTASASVSLKNGNFFIGFVDIVYPGGFEPKIERTYNSKSTFKGVFGWGWGTKYEGYIRVSADGSIIVHEYGGGAENQFIPVKFDEKDLADAVEKISGAARASGLVSSSARYEEYKKKLKSDSSFRNTEWQKWVNQKKLAPRQLAEGVQLRSARYSYQYITKVKDGYIRVHDGGNVEKFNNLGKLVMTGDRAGNKIEFEYGSDGRMSKMVDQFNRKMFFTYNARGLMTKVQGEAGKSAEYRYNGNDELVWSRDTSNQVHQFDYSEDKHHNLVQVSYPDKRTLKVTYYDKKTFENVKSIKEKNGEVLEYTYKNKAQNGANRVVGIIHRDSKGKIITKSEYAYFYKTNSRGDEWTQRLISSIDDEVNDTTYNEEFGLPVQIKTAAGVTSFKYDPKGRVTEKSTPRETTKLKYDAKLGKVTRVDVASKKSGAKPSWSEFSYDSKGSLIFAKNDQNETVKLIYDSRGKIVSMVDRQGQKLDFKYNEQSRPVEINNSKLGTIVLSYGNDGSIKNVESRAVPGAAAQTTDRRIAMELTGTFQKLLDIVKPAGVSLSF